MLVVVPVIKTAGLSSTILYMVSIELLDVGGCTSHENSRSIFYNPVHGEYRVVRCWWLYQS